MKVWGDPHCDADHIECDDGHLIFIGEDTDETPHCYSFEGDDYAGCDTCLGGDDGGDDF